MNLALDMFASKWHLITLGLILLAFISLYIGGYDQRTILRSGGGAALLLYIITTIPIAVISYEIHDQERKTIAQMDLHYYERANDANRKGRPFEENNKLAAGTFAFWDDTSADIVIYAGNYSDSYTFRGKLLVTTLNKEGRKIHEKTYDNVVLNPNDKKKIDKVSSSQELDSYTYTFTPEP
ncbi:hypothetical protein [Paenibacillus lutrae]|uniref:Uncharacterized protein n=1 Tax=Paenibacillus lutrae TaxID=2078573 RepID=A0A7X3FKY6_9BACL|nr:hypothetical protein [Paenibacillus lutrae]MVP01640.1 hypothetical protein [Paenibacillus lutrae]